MSKTLPFNVLIFSLIFSSVSYSQEMKRGIEYKFEIKTYIESKSVVWYGWDFSNSRMNDFAKLSEGELMVNKYIPGICERLNKRYPPELIEKNLDKQNFTYDFGSVQKLYQNLNTKEYVVSTSYSFSVDDLKNIIKGYDLPQSEGVGFVINVEELNKTERFVTGYVTFFDIKTKEILWTTKMKGKPGSKYGLAMYWLEGVSELYEYFNGDIYRKTIKTYKKEFGL
jgi:hypothetical protein